MINNFGPLKVGIGGPVGAGKTSLTEALCKKLSKKISMAVISNDIYTIEDAEYLMKAQALPLERIKGVETGGCPHTAIREDASINLLAVDELKEKFLDNLKIIEKFAVENTPTHNNYKSRNGYKGKKKEVAWVIWGGNDYEVAELVCTLRKLIK